MHTLTTAPPSGFFRSEKTASPPVRVDRTAKVIFGASLMQEGDLNDDRPWTVTRETLLQAKALGTKGSGLKARFTHPNMSSDGMGSYLGRWKNLRIDGDTLRGDLHIADAASKSPQGDLSAYVLDMADDDPEAFGVSLATELDLGDLSEFEGMQEAGEVEATQKWAMRFSGIRAGDIVDEPAATRGGLFDLTTPDLRNLPRQATTLLQTYFGDASPEVVRVRINQFLDRYFSNKGGDMPDEITEQETPAAETEPTTPEASVEPEPEVEPVAAPEATEPVSLTDPAALGRYMDTFGDAEGARLFRSGIGWNAALQQNLQAMRGQVQDLQAENAQLKSRCAELAKGHLGEDSALNLGQHAPKKPVSFGEACRANRGKN